MDRNNYDVCCVCCMQTVRLRSSRFSTPDINSHNVRRTSVTYVVRVTETSINSRHHCVVPRLVAALSTPTLLWLHYLSLLRSLQVDLERPRHSRRHFVLSASGTISHLTSHSAGLKVIRFIMNDLKIELKFRSTNLTHEGIVYSWPWTSLKKRHNLLRASRLGILHRQWCPGN